MMTDIRQLDLSKRYTYTDYLTWQFTEMVELIRGRIFRMSPAPGKTHQQISGNLFLVIGNYLKAKNCQLFHAPFDVRLPTPGNNADDPIDTVVQPDLCVICDPEKLQPEGCIGAPDWIIEILSPSTASKDLNEKFFLYQASGVQEYWIVHPEEGTVLVYVLDQNGKYHLPQVRPYSKEDQVASHVFPELVIPLVEVFN